jgi:hypothetical protein
MRKSETTSTSTHQQYQQNQHQHENHLNINVDVKHQKQRPDATQVGKFTHRMATPQCRWIDCTKYGVAHWSREIIACAECREDEKIVTKEHSHCLPVIDLRHLRARRGVLGRAVRRRADRLVFLRFR